MNVAHVKSPLKSKSVGHIGHCSGGQNYTWKQTSPARIHRIMQTHTDMQTDTDRQMQTDTHTDRHAHRQAHMHRQTCTQTNRQTHTDTGRCRQIHKQTLTQIDIHRQTDTQTQKHTDPCHCAASKFSLREGDLHRRFFPGGGDWSTYGEILVM